MRKIIQLKNNSQMITIMGIVLALSVFMISSLGAEIANINFIVTSDQSTSLTTEFSRIKETFGIALNYNLVDIYINTSTSETFSEFNESFFDGDISQINSAFNQTKDDYFNLYLRYGIFFDSKYNNCWYAYDAIVAGNYTIYYKVSVTLLIDDGTSSVAEDVTYTIACTPII